MAGKPPFLAVVSWLPLGLEKIEGCVDGVRVVAGEDRDFLEEAFAEAEVAFVGAFDAGLLRVARNLRWVHAGSGGVEGYMFPQMVESAITLTCSKPCFDSTGAEYALGMMLAFSRRLHVDLRHRPDREWEWSVPGTLRSRGQWPTELKGRTVGILGLGVMGSEIARVAKGFGMRVMAMARTRRTPPPTVDRLLGPAQMDELLAGSDFVVLSLPLTPETRGAIGERELGMMKDSACFIDVSGRPALYDLEAVRRALVGGSIAGAALQLEVPAPDSALWEVENLLMSFHRVVTREEYQRCVELFCENLRRYCQGQPLLGLVDKSAGY